MRWRIPPVTLRYLEKKGACPTLATPPKDTISWGTRSVEEKNMKSIHLVVLHEDVRQAGPLPTDNWGGGQELKGAREKKAGGFIQIDHCRLNGRLGKRGFAEKDILAASEKIVTGMKGARREGRNRRAFV